MKTKYDSKQKYLLMTIALMASMIMLGLNACQKKDTGADNPAQVTAETEDKAKDPLRDAAAGGTQNLEAGTAAVGEMVDAAREKTAAAYQEAADRVERSVDKGADTYEAAVQVAKETMDDWKEEASPAEANVNTIVKQTIPMKTD